MMRLDEALGQHVRAAEPWPELDTSVLRQGRRAPPPLDLGLFGERWAAWLRDAAEGSGAPVDYTATALLIGACAMVGNARSVTPWPSWAEPMILWAGLCGDPSSGKSPAVDPVRRAIAQVEDELSEGTADRVREWAAAEAAAVERKDRWQAAVREAVASGAEPPPLPSDAEVPPEPKPPRILVSDATIERIASLQAENSRGLLQFRDELAGWIGNFDRYGGGSGERAFWLEAFGGRPFVVDRQKNNGAAIRVPRLAISILGGIQPERAADVMLTSADDGLTSRLLWTWPERQLPRRPARSADKEFVAGAFRRLRELRPGADDEPVGITLAQDAADVFQAWREEVAGEAANASGILASALGKAPGQVLRIAGVIALLDWSAEHGATEPHAITVDHIDRACRIMSDYFLPMAQRVYGDAAVSPAEKGATRIARWLVQQRRVDVINMRDVRRRAGLPGIKDAKAASDAFSVLVETGWVRAVHGAGAPGRRRSDFEVNPAVWESLR